MKYNLNNILFHENDMYKEIKIVIVFLLSLFLASCHSDEEYLIHGRIRSVSDNVAYLMKMDQLGNMVIVDSTFIRGGEFRFRGHVDYPEMRFLRIGTRRPFDIFVENEKIEVYGSLLLPDEIKVEGSISHDDFNYLSSEFESIQNNKNALILELSSAQNLKDRKKIREINKRFSTYQDTIITITKQFVLNNPSSVGAAYFLCLLSSHYDVKKLEEIVMLIDPSIEDCQYVRYLKDELLLRKDLEIGTDAPSFCLKNSRGEEICLENYQGKYLFIDFGASWSIPSVRRYNQLLSLYREYSGYNFDIVSVSLDSDECDWKNYLAEVNPQWEFISDFLYWSSPVTKHYRVLNLPYGVLIDTQGKIVLINPSVDKLKRYLKQVLEN
ncbi:MAG: DUF4369 domain-containing protein [Bacteroidales bacterium]|nr:DUF4369 domain-containing protein [Bacteroidales bacterium]